MKQGIRHGALALTLALVLGTAGCSAKTAQDHFRQGEQDAASGQVDDAITSYQAGLKLEPNSAVGHHLLGLAYRAKYNALREAHWKEMELDSFQEAVACDSTFWPGHIDVGVTLYYMGDPVAAAPHFVRALALYPQNPERRQLEAFILEGGEALPDSIPEGDSSAQ